MAELLLQPFEALGERLERHAVGGVLGVEPPGTEAELGAPTAHVVDLRHLDGEQSRQAEGRRGHHGAQADAVGLARDAGEREPRIGGPGEAVPAHGQEVVGAEEGVEAGGLGGLCHPQLLLVGGTLLGLHEDAEFHRPSSYPGPSGRGRGVVGPGRRARRGLQHQTPGFIRRDRAPSLGRQPLPGLDARCPGVGLPGPPHRPPPRRAGQLRAPRRPLRVRPEHLGPRHARTPRRAISVSSCPTSPTTPAYWQTGTKASGVASSARHTSSAVTTTCSARRSTLRRTRSRECRLSETPHV